MINNWLEKATQYRQVSALSATTSGGIHPNRSAILCSTLGANHYPIEDRSNLGHNGIDKIEVGEAAPNGPRDPLQAELQLESTYFDQTGNPNLVLKSFQADVRYTSNQANLLINLPDDTLHEDNNPVAIVSPFLQGFKKSLPAGQSFGPNHSTPYVEARYNYLER